MSLILKPNNQLYRSETLNNVKVETLAAIPTINSRINPYPPRKNLICYDVATKSILFSTDEFRWKVLLAL